MIAADWGGVGIPLYWRLLANKSGNSATQDRCKPLEKIIPILVISILGVERIEAIVGDREFIGEKWVGRLQALLFVFAFVKVLSSKWLTVLPKPPTGRKVNAFLKRLGGGEYLLLMGSFEPQAEKDIQKATAYRSIISKF
jgi:hypothetical protein